MPILFILFVVIPVIEITILIKVGQAIGGWYTVGLVLLSAFIGVNMLRYQGVTTLMRAQAKIQSGEMPLSEMRDGIVIAIGGALLITPGFVTDAIGFACLLPFTRGLFFKIFGERVASAFVSRGGSAHFYSQGDSTFEESHRSSADDIIEGEFFDVDDSNKTDDRKRIE